MASSRVPKSHLDGQLYSCHYPMSLVAAPELVNFWNHKYKSQVDANTHSGDVFRAPGNVSSRPAYGTAPFFFFVVLIKDFGNLALPSKRRKLAEPKDKLVNELDVNVEGAPWAQGGGGAIDFGLGDVQQDFGMDIRASGFDNLFR